MDNKYFDKEKQDKALKWLDEKWPEAKRICEICSGNRWTIGEEIVTPLSFQGSIHIGGKISPTISCLCLNCGNTKYFNAVIMGLVTGEDNGK